MTEIPCFVGIDISKRRLDVAIRPAEQHFTVPNTPAGLKKLRARLMALKPEIILLEASGGYEALVVEALRQADLPTRFINPLSVRQFARSVGIAAKTDRLDAGVLALYGEKIRPEPRALPSADQQQLKQLWRRQRQLQDMLVAENNRLETCHCPSVEHSHRQLIEALRLELQAIEQRIQELLQDHDDWGKKNELLQSAPGVGPKTAGSLIAWVPELGRLNRKEIAKLVGVAPINHDSGQKRGYRAIGGGRGAPRRVLYMATLRGVRVNPVLQRLYHRLLKRGKAKKVALVACMRKLLSILNAMVKNLQPWQPQTSFNP